MATSAGASDGAPVFATAEEIVIAVSDAPEENIWTAATDGRVDCIIKHLSAGIAPDVADSHGFTPLHAAASYSHADVLKVLLDALATTGRGVNCSDEDGDTPLHACESSACAELLVAAGADMALVNAEGQTPIEVAVEDDRTEMTLWLGMNMAARGLAIPTIGVPAMATSGSSSGTAAAAAAAAAASSASSGSFASAGGLGADAGAAGMEDDEDIDDDLPPGTVPTAFPDA